MRFSLTKVDCFSIYRAGMRLRHHVAATCLLA